MEQMEQLTPVDFFMSIDEHKGYTAMTKQHLHEVLEIYYLKQGEIAYFANDTVYTVKEGNIIIIPPAVIHKTINSNAMPRHRMLLYLQRSFLQEMRSAGFPLWDSVSILHTTNYERINQIFSDLLAEYEHACDPTMLKALCSELVVLLHRKTELKQSVVSESAQSKQISQIITYINQEYAAELTLEQLASKFFLSPGHLSRIFKRCIGLTFSDYLREYRIKKAIELMADSKMNITEIALTVGFNSTNHFCKTFKALIKETPLQYRKRLLQSMSGD